MAVNIDKQTLFSIDERAQLMQVQVDKLSQELNVNIIIHKFDNLLIDCAKDIGASVIFRGLRAVSDFEYEFQLAGMNRKLNNKVETIFLMSDVENQIISSRFVKEIALHKGDLRKFTTKSTIRSLKEIYA